MAICEFCRTQLFEHDDWHRGLARGHHVSAIEWQRSVDQFCTVCINLLRTIREAILQHTGESNSLLLESFLDFGILQRLSLPIYDVYLYESAARDQFELDFRPIKDSVTQIRIATPLKVIEEVVLKTITFKVYSMSYDDSSHALNQTDNASTKSSFGQIKQWLDGCKDHKLCPKLGTQTAFIPTRLLDLGVAKADGSFDEYVKLVETPDFEDKSRFARYATLSHCWGAFVKLQLKEKKLNAFKQKIGLEEFPQNFKDAIETARKIGISYIWIDSCCIIQDSSSDWTAEAKKMHQVYGHSYLNLAAASSKNCHEGFFRHRTIDSLQPSTIEVPWKGQKQICKVIRKDYWTSELLTEPLYRRAWVLQERMLSPRTVNFGTRQLFWQCLGTTACESMPDGIPDVISDGGRDELQWRALMNRDHQMVTDNEDLYLKEIWRHVVDTYMSCRITFSSDKFPALEGLVSKLKEVTGEKYFYGVWETKLVEQLAWQVRGCSTADMTPSRRYAKDEYVGPSWLWASVDGMIEVPKRLDRQRSYTLSTIGEPQFKNQPGKLSLESGHLDVRGQIYRIAFTQNDVGWDADLGDQAWCKLFPDEPLSELYTGFSSDRFESTVLPLFYTIEEQGVDGRALVIEAAGIDSASELPLYNRVGLVVFRNLGEEQWIAMQANTHDHSDQAIRLV